MPYLHRFRDDYVDSFWAKVQKTESCWNWTAGVDGEEYGMYRGGKAHRISYSFVYGEIPTGMVVRHICNNPRCVNPAHLRLGTEKQNRRDMILSERGGPAKLNWEAVAEIRRLRAAKLMTARALAQKYGVSAQSISRITTMKHWIPPTDDELAERLST